MAVSRRMERSGLGIAAVFDEPNPVHFSPEEFDVRAVTWRAADDVAVRDVPDLRIEEPTDAVLRVTSTAICGSDLHPYGVLSGYLSPGDSGIYGGAADTLPMLTMFDNGLQLGGARFAGAFPGLTKHAARWAARMLPTSHDRRRPRARQRVESELTGWRRHLLQVVTSPAIQAVGPNLEQP